MLTFELMPCTDDDHAHLLHRRGTYQVKTNFFVQTVQTSIWATGSTSKGYGELGNFTINRPPLDWVITHVDLMA